MGARVDITEHWFDAVPPERMRSGNERKGRYNHLTRQPHRASSDEQAHRGVTRRDAVADAEIFGESLLELLDQGPLIRQPLAVEEVAEALEELVPMADVRSPDMEVFEKGGPSAENGQVGTGLRRHGLVIQKTHPP